jgi:hypothetical protein
MNKGEQYMTLRLGEPTGARRDSALVENIDKVKPGQTQADVESIIGKADNPNGNEWLYYLDEHSGYVITFDSTDRVSNVQSWKS